MVWTCPECREQNKNDSEHCVCGYSSKELKNEQGYRDEIDQNTLKGLGGWLILVGVGLIYWPIKNGVLLYPRYSAIFLNGYWEKLMTPGSLAYNPAIAIILIAEAVANACVGAASIYILYLFFSRKRAFPKWYIAMSVLSLIVSAAQTIAIKFMQPDMPLGELGRALVQSLIVTCIWVPYMLRSVRVRATFVA